VGDLPDNRRAAGRRWRRCDPAVLADGYGADYYKTVGQILSNAAPLTKGKGGEEMIQAVGTELNDATAGNKSVADALRDAQAAAERIQQ
jgi:multiple sugar transport system substrate-binding protein